MIESPYYDKYAASRVAAREDANNAQINRPGWTAKLPATMPKNMEAPEGTIGSTQKVTRIPEPGPVAPGENPNNQQSVPRRTTLVENAKRGKEGAGTQLNQIHGPVLYEPKGAGYSGVREQIPLNEQGQAVPPIKGGSNGTIGQGPIGKPAAAPQGLTNIPSDVELLKALTQKNPGMDNATANRIVQETLDELDPTNKYVLPEVREQAQQRIQRIMGPEQRGPMRLGPEARGIK
jgi:hypothetical protein